MFVVNRNGNSLYPNQLIMMNAIMSDVLSQQRDYITGNNYNDQIIKTQLKVAGIFDESEKKPSNNLVDTLAHKEYSKYNSVIKGHTLTTEEIQKSIKILTTLDKGLRLIKDNIQTQTHPGLDKVKDASIIIKIEQLINEFKELSELIKMIKDNNIVLTDNLFLVINNNLNDLINKISILHTDV
jgi:hypothetical protein